MFAVELLQMNIGNYALSQGCTTFCYCRPHYFYFYEVSTAANEFELYL